jgi:hypothetical protein
MVVPQFSEVVRYYATTNQENSSFTVRQMEFAFDAWLAQVKKEAAAEARAEALEEVIKGVSAQTKKAKKGGDWEPLSRYDEGKNAGLATAYNIAYDLKNTTPA